jgi:hypothetical protein
MNKKIVYLISILGLIAMAGFALAGTTLKDPLGGATPESLLKKIATEVGKLITYLGTVMVIVAGIFYLTSAGSPERIGVAKKTLIYAIAGIAVGLGAQAIVEIVSGILKGG